MKELTKDFNGMIIKSNAGLYDIYLKAENQIIQTKSRGVLRHRKQQPLVGDYVLIEDWDHTAVMTKIMPRKNELIRPLIANVDISIIVISVKEPDFQQYLLDKYLALLEFNHIKPCIIFTKYDLLTTPEEKNGFKKVIDYYEKIGYPCFLVANKKLSNTERLENILANTIAVVMGQTGVGKSTLLNDLSDSQWQLQTNEISTALGRGKHTTRIVELFQLKNYWIADTPGFSSFNLYDIPSETLTQTFIEFADYACKFNDCIHVKEQCCGVKAAVEQGNILQVRYDSYLKVYKELKTQEENKKW